MKTKDIETLIELLLTFCFLHASFLSFPFRLSKIVWPSTKYGVPSNFIVWSSHITLCEDANGSDWKTSSISTVSLWYTNKKLRGLFPDYFWKSLIWRQLSPTDHVLLSRELSILYFDLWISFQRKQGASGVSTRGIPRNSIYEDVPERGTFSGFKWKGYQVFRRVEYMKGQNKLYDFE